MGLDTCNSEGEDPSVNYANELVRVGQLWTRKAGKLIFKCYNCNQDLKE